LFIPYGKQAIDAEDIQAVVEVLSSDWLTQGPAVERFEKAVAEYCEARFAVAVANGSAALHLAALAAGFGAGDEVVTTPLTFVASANCIAYCGASPVFADIDPESLCIDSAEVGRRLTSRTRGLIPVHFAGRVCDLPALARIGRENGLTVIEDAAHALGATYTAEGRTHRVGSCAHSDMTTFSFHPVKQITTAEGGVITTNREDIYSRLLRLRTHGITRDPQQWRGRGGPWYYEMQQLGFNYRISDLHCALGFTQLKKLERFLDRRRDIAEAYRQAFAGVEELILPTRAAESESAWHLFVLQFRSLDRGQVFDSLRDKGIGVNVHYIPVHLQPYYAEHFGCRKGDCPKAEAYYQRALTIPLFPAMTDMEVSLVIEAVLETIGGPE